MELVAALETARPGRREPYPGAWSQLRARVLLEADADPREARERALEAAERAPDNLQIPALIALAEARGGLRDGGRAYMRRIGLPHESGLLALFAFAIELRLRPWPAAPLATIDWPVFSSRDADSVEPPDSTEGADSEGDPSATPGNGAAPASRSEGRREASSADLPEVRPDRPAPKGFRARGRGRKAVARMQEDYFAGRVVEVARSGASLLAEGWDDSSIHLIAGLACEELGDGPRARAHLARSLALDPAQLLARTFLGRVHWRDGRLELAEELWRSLPVEGPDDYGRHYHLALAHESAGRRDAALEAMGIALRDFGVETREFYLARALRRYLAETDSPAAAPRSASHAPSPSAPATSSDANSEAPS